jgi:hypothetical protein
VPRGDLRELEIGLPGVHRGRRAETVSASAHDYRLLRQTPRPVTMSRRAWRGCPVLKSGIADREDEPSLPIRPWPAGGPVEPVYSLARPLTRRSVADNRVRAPTRLRWSSPLMGDTRVRGGSHTDADRPGRPARHQQECSPRSLRCPSRQPSPGYSTFEGVVPNHGGRRTRHWRSAPATVRKAYGW